MFCWFFCTPWLLPVVPSPYLTRVSWQVAGRFLFLWEIFHVGVAIKSRKWDTAAAVICLFMLFEKILSFCWVVVMLTRIACGRLGYAGGFSAVTIFM